MTPPPSDLRAGRGPKTRVLVPYDEKTLFDLVTDPRVEVQRSFDAERQPDLVVLPSSRLDLSFRKAAELIPPEVWRRVAVVFDGSLEGPVFSEAYVRKVRLFLARREVSEQRCAYITQNRAAAWPGSDIRILHYDYWIRRLFSWSREEGLAEFERRRERFHERPKVRPRRFLSFNLTARASKLLFLLILLRDGLWDQGYVSFGGFQHLAEAQGRSLQDVRNRVLLTPGFQDLAAELIQYIPALDAKGQILFGRVKRRSDGSLRKPTDGAWAAEFDQSWFTAATETEMSAAVDRITEKSFKALVSFHPQVILGNAGALKRLGAYGFQSFSPWIDEAYDQEPDPRRRFDMAYGEIRRLCAADEATLARMEEGCAERLIANARNGFVDLPARYREVLDPEIVSQLLALASQGAAAPA